MNITTEKVHCYNAKRKVLMSVDGKPFLIVSTRKRADKIAAYINGADVELSDGRVLRLIKNLLEG